MSPEVSGIIVGAASIVGAGLLTWLAATLVRLWRLPKRMDRVEAISPLLLRAVMILFDVNLIEVRCQQGKSCNGDLDEAVNKMGAFRKEMDSFLSGAAISQKARQ